jgi:pyruvate,water dikinase
LISSRLRPAEGKFVLPLSEVYGEIAEQVGLKIANLGEARNRMGLRIPNGFVVTARGYRRFIEYNDLQTEIDRRLQVSGADRRDHLFGLADELQQLIAEARLPWDLEEGIRRQYLALEGAEGSGVTVAVRSSALREDVAGASFAGQYLTELNVGEASLFDSYKAVVASKYNAQAMSYRLRRGIRDDDVVMCVGILSMVDAVAGGVLYSRNPLDSRDDSIIINSAWGLPKPVSDGRVPVDHFVIARGDPLKVTQREIPAKKDKSVCIDGEGIGNVDLTGEESAQSSISDRQILDLARLAMRLEEHHGVAQDVEWAVDREGEVVLLQSRPLMLRQVATEEVVKKKIVAPPEQVILNGGITAGPGAAAGRVSVVRSERDALRVPDGAILVTHEALPRWAALLGTAAAVISEHGTVAGHLASVAREFGVPALFGVAGAVERLRDGQEVTVDADGRAVYDGRIEDLPDLEARPPNIMLGSPVYRALKRASRHINPLHLLDPDSNDFKAENCRTFHDLTRFCHEKAVQEMFRFGKDHHFPERSSKRLYCDTPMQWWVLNLDDGFKKETGGKYVELDNIVSIPMLALWEGIMAVPWEGPPPVDGKGFMSVMFEAVTRPALVPSVRSRYHDRNYFMLSRNYCCLNSRLGAHFSIIEAFVSERLGENYVSFQFRGGAADYERRLKRVIFIKEILVEHGFRVELNDDNAIARLEGRDKDFMVERLRILGYLTLHTRQLDMIMSKPAAVSYYSSKIRQDIQTILSD